MADSAAPPPTSRGAGAIAVAAAVAALLIPVIDFAVTWLSESRSSGATIATLGVILGGSSGVVALVLGFVTGLDRQRPRHRSQGWVAIVLALIALPLNGVVGWLVDLMSTPLN